MLVPTASRGRCSAALLQSLAGEHSVSCVTEREGPGSWPASPVHVLCPLPLPAFTAVYLSTTACWVLGVFLRIPELGVGLGPPPQASYRHGMEEATEMATQAQRHFECKTRLSKGKEELWTNHRPWHRRHWAVAGRGRPACPHPTGICSTPHPLQASRSPLSHCLPPQGAQGHVGAGTCVSPAAHGQAGLSGLPSLPRSTLAGPPFFTEGRKL